MFTRLITFLESNTTSVESGVGMGGVYLGKEFFELGFDRGNRSASRGSRGGGGRDGDGKWRRGDTVVDLTSRRLVRPNNRSKSEQLSAEVRRALEALYGPCLL